MNWNPTINLGKETTNITSSSPIDLNFDLRERMDGVVVEGKQSRYSINSDNQELSANISPPTKAFISGESQTEFKSANL